MSLLSSPPRYYVSKSLAKKKTQSPGAKVAADKPAALFQLSMSINLSTGKRSLPEAALPERITAKRRDDERPLPTTSDQLSKTSSNRRLLLQRTKSASLSHRSLISRQGSSDRSLGRPPKPVVVRGESSRSLGLARGDSKRSLGARRGSRRSLSRGDSKRSLTEDLY